MNNNYVLKKYLGIAIQSHFSENVLRSNKWNFRCNICLDSKKSNKKKRGWVELKKDNWIFKCYNCGKYLPAEKWLKQYFPEYFRLYLSELYQQKVEEKEIVKEENAFDQEKKTTKFFFPINHNNSELFKIALKYCNKRKISESIYSKWYVATGDKYKNRLIIPFYDDMDKIYYWQGRSLINQEPKYLNRTHGKDEAIYNYYHINKDNPVIVLEGVIDSLFVENSIATLSTSWSDIVQNKLDELKCYYLLDYDNSEHTKKYIKKLLEKGKYLFNWKLFIKDYQLPMRDKWDINEVIIYKNLEQKFTFEQLKPYFTNNFYDWSYFI